MKRHIHPFILTFLFFSLTLLLSACMKYGGFSKYQHIAAGGWERSDTISFFIDTLSQDGTYELSVGLRMLTVGSYPFKSLSLEVTQTWEKPAVFRCDTLLCSFYDEENKKKGPGISLQQYKFSLNRMPLSAHSKGKIQVRHVMLRPIIEGICDVGVELQAVD